MKLQRAFLALHFPHQVAAMIATSLDSADWANQLKLQQAADYHLTLHFLDDLEWTSQHRERMQSLASQLPALSYSLTATGVFTHTRSMTLWLAASGAGLSELHQLTGDAILATGLSPDRRPFVPHITVARHNKIDMDLKDRFESWPLPPTTPVACPELLLMARTESDQAEARYQVIERYPYKDSKPSI